MKITQQLAIAALLGSLMATSAVAYGGNRGDCTQSSKMEGKSQMNNQGLKNQKEGMKQNKGKKGSIMGMANLNLSAEQAYEIKLLRAQMKVERLKAMGPNVKSPKASAFSSDGFDKDAFIKAQTTKAQNKAKIKATYMEKLYNILTPQQREQWVKNIQSCPKRSE